jgi:hypothetical protein
MSDPRTGRGFLQQIGTLLPSCPAIGHFFETLKSKRRLALLKDVDMRLGSMIEELAPLPDSRSRLHHFCGRWALAWGGGARPQNR